MTYRTQEYIFSAIILLFGCGLSDLFASGQDQDVVTTEVSHRVYWINRDETRIREVAQEFTSSDVEDLISECLACLSETPDDNVYRSVLSGKVHVTNYVYDGDSKQVIPSER